MQKGYGIEKVIAAVHKRGDKIYASIVPIKLATTILIIATGGSAGQVGPCGQIGAALSSVVADLFKFDENDRKKLVIWGLSAGFASVLGAPFAGAIFGVVVDIGTELENVKTTFKHRDKSLIGLGLKAAEKIINFYRKRDNTGKP